MLFSSFIFIFIREYFYYKEGSSIPSAFKELQDNPQLKYNILQVQWYEIHKHSKPSLTLRPFKTKTSILRQEYSFPYLLHKLIL